MDSFTTGTVRACCERLLAATTRPLTTAAIADQVATTPAQARRALRQLENAGIAVRQTRSGPGVGGTYWRATRSGRPQTGR